MDDKRPRKYVDEILAKPKAADRKAALRAIEDPKIRAWVRFQVEEYFAKRFKRPLPDLQQIVAEETAASSSGGLATPEHAPPSCSSGKSNNELESSSERSTADGQPVQMGAATRGAA